MSKVTIVAYSAAAMLLEMPAKRRFVLLNIVSSALIGLLAAVTAIEPATASPCAASHLLGRPGHVLLLELGVHGCAHHLRKVRLRNESYALDARFGFTLRIEIIEALTRIHGHHARHRHHERHLLLLLGELHRHLSLVVWDLNRRLLWLSIHRAGR